MIVVSGCSLIFMNIATTLCWDYASLATCRFLFGVAAGLALPPQLALVSELTPGTWRLVAMTLPAAVFLVSKVYMMTLVFFDDPTLHRVHWRFLTRWLCLQAIIPVLLTSLFLIESPRWLAGMGRHAEAREALRAIAISNGRGDICVDFRAKQPPARAPVVGKSGTSLAARLRVVFGPKYAWSTLVLLLHHFSKDFAFVGCEYAIGRLLPEADLGISAAGLILLGSLVELPGILVACAVGQALNRIPAIGLAFTSMAVCMAAFAVGQDAHSARLMSMGFLTFKVVPHILAVVGGTYCAELYPTSSRSLGISTVEVFARMGSVTGPIAYEVMTWYSSPASFFYVCSVLSGACALLSRTLPIETSGARLVDHEGEDGAALCQTTGEHATRAAAYGTTA